MQDDNTPKQDEREAEVKAAFTPAPNPFEKSTTQPEDMAQQVEQDQQPARPAAPIAAPTPAEPLQPESVPEAGGVELVGKTASQKPDSGQLPPPKKRSFLGSWLGGGQKKAPDDAAKEKPNVPEQILMSWQSPEFVQTHKPVGWYIGFGVFFAVLIVIAIFTRQYITVGLFALMGVALFIYANRPPRILHYELSNYGVKVGEKKYLFDDFGSYYQTSDYGQPVLELVPNKRFGTLVSLPPAEHQIDELEGALGQMLPKVNNREDVVDKLFRALRF